LPFALDGLGWAPGFLALTIATAVSFYAYTLISKVLEQAELEGHRFLRFRDVAGYVLGKESILQPDSQFFCTNSLYVKLFCKVFVLHSSSTNMTIYNIVLQNPQHRKTQPQCCTVVGAAFIISNHSCR
jgi:hypothetical protein